MLHAAITLLFVLVGSPFGFPLWGWLCAYGGGQRENMPWWGGFDPKVWNLKSLCDWLLPLCVAVLGGLI